MNDEKIEYLYKYRPLYSYWNEIENSETGEIISKIKVEEPILNKHTLNILTKGELYFSIPKEFNDPYDCELNVLFNEIGEKELFNILKENSSDSIYRYLRHLIINHFGNDLSHFVNNYNKDKYIFKDLFYKYYSKLQEELKICCFSSDCDNFLMWSHYSDCHRGVCIGIEYSQKLIITSKAFDIEYCEFMKPVRYNTTNNIIPRIPFFEITDTKVKDIYYNKAGYWDYEKEYRTVIIEKENPGSTIFYIKKEQVKELIFGSKVPDEMIRLTLREIINSGFIDLNNIKIFKMQKVTDCYKLERIEIILEDYIKKLVKYKQ